jgi:hypothetical protein
MMSLSEQRWTSGSLAMMFFVAACYQSNVGASVFALACALAHALRWMTLMWERAR